MHLNLTEQEKAMVLHFISVVCFVCLGTTVMLSWKAWSLEKFLDFLYREV